jgi:hypothetical protein
MSDRSTLDIILAVKDCTPATEEELRLALMALSHMLQITERTLHDLAEAVREGKPSAKMRAANELREYELRVKGRKMPPKEYLGPTYTPGTPENAAAMKWANGVYKAATGQDI